MLEEHPKTNQTLASCCVYTTLSDTPLEESSNHGTPGVIDGWARNPFGVGGYFPQPCVLHTAHDQMQCFQVSFNFTQTERKTRVKHVIPNQHVIPNIPWDQSKHNFKMTHASL